MGMQVHFPVAQVAEHGIKHYIEIEDGIASLYCSDGPEIRIFNLTSSNKCAWFDAGSASSGPMDDIRWLIRNRICFSCS